MDHRPGGKEGPEAADVFRLTILGSGTCVPSLRRSSCSLMVEAGGSLLVLDCGPGTMRRITEAGQDVHDVGFLFLSHFHPDHSGELAAFLFANKYPDPDRRKIPLNLTGGTGFRAFMDGLRRVYGRWIDLPAGRTEVDEMRADGYDVRLRENFRVESLPMNHNPESLGYRITGPGGRSVVYSGDTDVCDNLVTLARDADVLVCESALPDDRKVEGHLTPSAAGHLASRAAVGKLVLTHFYPECEGVDLVAECRKTYSGPLVLAEDLLQIEPGKP